MFDKPDHTRAQDLAEGLTLTTNCDKAGPAAGPSWKHCSAWRRSWWRAVVSPSTRQPARSNRSCIYHRLKVPTPSMHCKKEPKLCCIVACDEAAEIDLDEALERLREAVLLGGFSSGTKASKANRKS
jgi:hypothetical protein